MLCDRLFDGSSPTVGELDLAGEIDPNSGSTAPVPAAGTELAFQALRKYQPSLNAANSPIDQSRVFSADQIRQAVAAVSQNGTSYYFRVAADSIRAAALKAPSVAPVGLDEGTPSLVYPKYTANASAHFVHTEYCFSVTSTQICQAPVAIMAFLAGTALIYTCVTATVPEPAEPLFAIMCGVVGLLIGLIATLEATFNC